MPNELSTAAAAAAGCPPSVLGRAGPIFFSPVSELQLHK